jgi:predicted TIM-barrel fold metal-dependent hydrolase
MIKRIIAILALLIFTIDCNGLTLAIEPTDLKNVEIPIIDAHSQIPFQAEKLKKIINLMDRGGVACVILSSKGPLTAKALASFALKYPGRILPAVRTKCRAYRENKVKDFENFLKKQINIPQFGAMAEMLLYHAQKGTNRIRAPEVIVFPDDKRVQTAFAVAQKRDWPFILHIEFRRAGSLADEFMTKFEALLDEHPTYPFLLMHMGQLNHSEVQRLIEAHTNIYFITSHSTYIAASPIAEVKMPNDFRTNMFDGRQLAVQWGRLLKKYPERFVLGFDNVWPEHWNQYYLDQIKIWREVLKELPSEVAHALAHRNAERLWHLKTQE